MKKITTLFVFVCTVVCYAQEEVLLRLNYKTGDEYKVNVSMKQEMKGLMSSDMLFDMSQKITSTTDSIYENVITIDHIVMEVTQAGTKNIYDSSKEITEDDTFGTQMKASVGNMIGVEIYAKGNYLGEVFDTKTDKPIPGLENMTNNNGVVYPKEPVKVGSSWQTEKNQNGMNLTFVYTVLEITQSMVKLDVSGTIAGLEGNAISGNLSIDRATGVASESKIIIEIEMQGQKVLTELVMKTEKV